jgi:hypothetical protein
LVVPGFFAFTDKKYVTTIWTNDGFCGSLLAKNACVSDVPVCLLKFYLDSL